LPGTLNVQVSHQQSVSKLAGDARIMATTEMDAHHAFRFGDSAWGIQFHPEFDKAIVKKYVAFYQNQTGNKVKENKLADAPEAVMILQQFAKLIRQ
jgi:GMP synthase (glutamine-hydrolysing)